VTSVGHANARVAEAVAAQMESLVHVSNLFYTEPQVRLAERLCELSGLDRVFFSNDGATANEAAIKLARRWGRKQRGPDCYEIISLDGSFHGRTLATLAATGQPEKQTAFSPLPPGFSQVPPGDLEALAAAIHSGTAAVLIETIQGEGGVLPLEEAYLTGLRKLCDERQILLIVDDVQAGIGRTGTWFSWQQLGLEPDIATSAKALANGLPIGACLATGAVAKAFRPGDHATTFGGGPVVCAAALATGVVAVRGRGLLLAAVLEQPVAAEVVAGALEEGLVVNNVRSDAVRFTPPLTLSSDEASAANARFKTALSRTLT
jgi:acetylornithine/succinyldiaminopimelate/putrescine aminotransferase